MSYNFTTANYDELTQADKKRYHRLQLKDQLAEIQSTMKGVLSAREELKKQVSRYQNSQDQFSVDYINGLIQREQQTANSAYQSYKDKALKALDKARQAVDNIHAIVDLGDIRMTNAIQIIQASGKSLKPEMARQLVNEFAGDQTALTMLQGIFASASYDGGLDSMIYNVESAFMEASNGIQDHFTSQDGSMNYVARRIAVIAKGEGVDFPTVFDSTEVDRYARKAAGLPVD